MPEVTLVKATQRKVDADKTAGMTREAALVTDGMWAGFVRTSPRMASGWHHHADYDTSIYVLKGRIRIESGAGGTRVVEGTAGDFIRVPANTVHRESNPEGEEGQLIVVRAGHGVPSVNVDGPPDA